MRKLKIKKFNFYGIQNRFLKYVMIILASSFFLSSIGIGAIVSRNIRQSVIEKYEFINEKIMISLENQYEKSNDIMEKCIIHNDFQKSLLKRETTMLEKEGLYRWLSDINFTNLEDYAYIDNKENVYVKPYQKLDYKTFEESGFSKLLGNDYSKTKWIWREDTLFNTQQKALFIGRYIRNMDFYHKPGMLFLKMNNKFFEEILETVNENEGTYFFMDNLGNICYEKLPNGSYISDESKEKMASMIQLNIKEGFSNKSYKINDLKEGIYLYNYDNKSGFTIATLIPNSVLNQVTKRIIGIMLVGYLIVLLFVFYCSVYFSKRFTKPIKDINSAMVDFDGIDFSKTLHINTNTELDTIGKSYNKMLLNMRKFVNEIKKQEQELRNSELHSLIYQINPHFLYNTLDTIYMLARISKEECTMKMIQALSKFLKVSLSKGSDVISISDEIEHVKSYMDIQKIRNNDLFTYEIYCDPEMLYCKVLKLILQPIVENAIKHGFCDIYEGGIIKINIYIEEENLVFIIYNNGKQIQQDIKNKINNMINMNLNEIKENFSNKNGGYGIGNVISRLRLKYGNAVQLCYENEDDGIKCAIKIPKVNLKEGSVYEFY
ncbi:histidine kinase [Clostridium sp.]|uniref:sensor histidine kinase n=1 Tax=Clostridium sp. TaxID=1506 RepID=UPI002848B54B|nr:histidine kinase [Clostridium sp.]MDR3593919.1 histidine kinase [Clostridium sp.]